MNNISSKKLYFYISLSLIFTYFTFALIAYNAQIIKELYTLEYCSLYYLFAYVLLSGISYIVDIGSKKEPGFLTLFCLPAYSFIFLFAMMLLTGVSWPFLILLVLVFGTIFGLGYYCYKHLISKIFNFKIGYDNTIFIYVIVHLFIVLLIAFKLLKLL